MAAHAAASAAMTPQIPALSLAFIPLPRSLRFVVRASADNRERKKRAAYCLLHE